MGELPRSAGSQTVEYARLVGYSGCRIRHI